MRNKKLPQFLLSRGRWEEKYLAGTLQIIANDNGEGPGRKCKEQQGHLFVWELYQSRPTTIFSLPAGIPVGTETQQ